MWLFVLFLAVPLIEIALFIQIGGWIGLWPTLAVVVLTAVLGTWLVRREGMRALADLRQSFETLGDPAAPLAHGAAILFAGALLLTPGFFTDTVGFLLLIPAVRTALFRHLAQRIRVERFSYGTARSAAGEGVRNAGSGQVVEGEWEEVPPAQQPTHRPSGWTRH
jgi:UPF0716 protein FxsA